MIKKSILLSLLICPIVLFSSEENRAGPSKETMVLSIIAGTTTGVVCLPFLPKASTVAVCLCCTAIGTWYGQRNKKISPQENTGSIKIVVLAYPLRCHPYRLPPWQ